MRYHDHHFHPFGYVSMVLGLELMDSPDIESVLQAVLARSEEVDGPVIGQRLNDEGLREQRLPTARDIDDVVSDRPVLLYRYCGHIAVANTEALRLAGVGTDTADPPGGSFDREAGGRPNGILRETAIPLVSDVLERLTVEPTDSDIISALAGLPTMGIESITGIVSVDGAVWCGVSDEVGTLVRLAPDLPIDIDVLVIADTPETLASARDRLDRTEGRVRFHGYKAFIDGSLGGHTAAMYEPFADRRDTRGTERFDHAHEVAMGQASLDLGGVVAIHAIGDRANDLVLDVHQDLRGAGADPSRLRVEHASVLTDETIERMVALGVTASIQPAFLASEEDWLEKRLGPERMSRAYRFRSLLESGVPLLGGSDCPVELPDPTIGINAAVERHGINPDEALTPRQAEALFAPPPG